MTTERNSRVVLITGATGGLGASVVRAFTGEGARLVLTARRQQELEAIAEEAGLDADRVLIVTADATDPAAVERVVGAAHERFGALDVVVHVSGGFKGGTPASATDLETWNFMLGLNLTSAFLVARAVLPGMLDRGYGKLVFISSKGGRQPAANQAAYAASKGGLEILVRDLAEETRARGVNVNAVAPSIIDTPANRKANPDADYASWVRPESLAGVIHFLASDTARDIHGAIVPVYGNA
ncbi:MAG TPA: SDR family NAD(P)-dependent oxidoreductase [Roseiflexaceae bacterium]